MPDVSLTESQRLRRKIALGFTDYSDTALALRRHPDLRGLLPDYFFTMHCIMRATVPLMATALDESIRRSKTDPVAARLVHYYGEHVPEELGHDEWLMENVLSIGGTRSDVEDKMPPASVAAMSGTQYYWIRHYHPVALLGYIAVVEGYPPDEDSVREMAESTGLPTSAFSSMMRHARLDQVHRDDFDKFLDTLPLNPNHRQAIGVSALHTIGAATAALQDVVGRFASRRVPRLRTA